MSGMLGPELVETKPKGEGFRRRHVELDLASGALRATLTVKPVDQVDGTTQQATPPPPKRLLVNCAYGTTFQEPPAKYAEMHVLALQEPGKPAQFLRFESDHDKARWKVAIEGTMVKWPARPMLSFEFMSGPVVGSEPELELEPEPESMASTVPEAVTPLRRTGDGLVELIEPREADAPITDKDFTAARAVVSRFEQLDALSQVPSYSGHPSNFRLLTRTEHIALYKSKERGTKHFVYRPSPKSCEGIPARFVQEVMRDDDFAMVANPQCTEFQLLGCNSAGNSVLFQVVEMSNFKTKPRELLAMRERRTDAEDADSGTEETMLRSTFHPDKPLQHQLDETNGKDVSAFRAYQFVYSLVRPKAGEPESCEVMGLMRLQPRGDCPRKAIDTVATQVVKDVWARVRVEAIARMEAAGLAPPVSRPASDVSM